MQISRRLKVGLTLSWMLFGSLSACSSDNADTAPDDTPASGGMGGAGGVVTGGSIGAGAGGVAAGAGGTGTGGNAPTAGANGGSAGGGGSIVDAGDDASDGAAGAELDGGEPPDDDRPPASSIDVPPTVEPGGVEPWFNIYRPMDLAAVEGALPVIVWANGGCVRADFAWAMLFNRWAAAGFIVLALSESPTDGLFGPTVPEDQGKLIDWTLAQAAMDGGEYEGKLDVDRVIAAGNSCGGVTALNLAAVDERVAAVFVLSGSSALAASDAAVMAAITAPVGFVTGSPEEDAAHPNADMDYGLISDGVPAMLVHRTSGDHLFVSTDEAVLKQEADIALNWMDLAVYGTKEALDMLTSPDVCGSCESGTWVLKSKHMEALER